MSDTSQGTGWWQASDGKWYSPDLYPSDWPVSNPTEQPEVGVPAEPETPIAETEPVLADPVPTATPPQWDPPPTESVAPTAPLAPAPTPPPENEPLPEPSPPSGWAAPDPAAGEPTLVEGIEPIVTPDATMVQPSVAPPVPPPIAPVGEAASPDWSAPSAPVAPPATWDAPQAPLAPSSQPIATGMAEASKARGDAFAGMFGLVGGAALIVGSFLAWAKAGGTLTSGTVNGLTGSNGWGTLVGGLVVASCAGLLMAGVRKIWVGAAVVLASLVALGLAIYSYIDIGNTSDDLPGLLSSQEGVGADIANGALLDYDIGLWIVMAGAGVALVAGFIALARRQ